MFALFHFFSVPFLLHLSLSQAKPQEPSQEPVTPEKTANPTLDDTVKDLNTTLENEKDMD